MAKIDVTQLDKDLRNNRVSQVYVVIGEDHYLRSSARSLIRAVTDGDYYSFEGDKLKGKEAVDALLNMTLTGGKRVIVVDKVSKIKEKARDSLLKYIQKPVDDAVLILESEKLDGRTKFAQQLQKLGTVVECKPLYADKIPSWINIESKRRGKNISHDAAQFLAQISGSDMGMIIQSLEKIILYVGDQPLIELKDVEEAVADTAQKNIFDLTNALGERRQNDALFLLRNLMDHAQPPVIIIAMIARHFRIIAHARELPRGVNEREAAGKLKVHPFYVRQYLSQAKNLSRDKIQKAFYILSRTDKEVKSSKIPRDKILERTVIDLCM